MRYRILYRKKVKKWYVLEAPEGAQNGGQRQHVGQLHRQPEDGHRAEDQPGEHGNPYPWFSFQKPFSELTALSAHSAVQSFMEATVRAYVLCSDRDQLLSVFRAGTPAFTSPAKALEVARASGSQYIILWSRSHRPYVFDGKTVVDLDGARASRINRTENARLRVINGQMHLSTVDPDLPV